MKTTPVLAKQSTPVPFPPKKRRHIPVNRPSNNMDVDKENPIVKSNNYGNKSNPIEID